MKRGLKVGQVWEWSWDGRVEQHLLLSRESRDDHFEEWRSFRLDTGMLWRVSFLISIGDNGAWTRLS